MDYGITATASPLQPLAAAGYWTAQDLFGPIIELADRFAWPVQTVDLALAVARYAPELAARSLGLEHDEAAAQALWKQADTAGRDLAQRLALATAGSLEAEKNAYYKAHPDELQAAQAQASAAAEAKWGGLPGAYSTESWQDVRDQLDARETTAADWLRYAKIAAAVLAGGAALRFLTR